MLVYHDKPEIFPLGSSSVLHSRHSGAITMADHAAVEIGCAEFENWCADRPISDAARHILNDWERSGLLRTQSRKFANALAWREPHADTVKLGLSERTVTMRCEDPFLEDDLLALLAPLLTEQDGMGSTCIDILADRGGYGIFCDGQAVWGVCDVFVARHLTLREILVAVNGSERIGAMLHSAAVERDGKCLVLAGDSGSGKSTLAMQLIASGWRQVADDLVGLDLNADCVPFPTRMSLKSGSWPLIDPCILETAPLKGVGGLQQRYVDPQATVPPTRSVSSHALVFPQYQAGASVQLAPISPEEAFVRLVDCGARVVGAQASIGVLVQSARETPAHMLIHGGGTAVERSCEALLSGAMESVEGLV